jgi:hypothetical protein
LSEFIVSDRGFFKQSPVANKKSRAISDRPMSGAVANNVGDSFLNKCYEKSPFFADLLVGLSLPAVFGWTESYPLIILLLVLLIILPSIFTRTSSFLKISRIYDTSRLGLISVFHQCCYSYSVATPL